MNRNDSPDLKSTGTLLAEDYPMGNHVEGGITSFKVFSAKANGVEVVCFRDFQGIESHSLRLEKDESGIWFGTINEDLTGFWYAYRLLPPRVETEYFIPTQHLIADPWSTYVTSVNHYLGFPKTKILGKSEFEWEDQKFETPDDIRDLVIYETHIKDMVAHPSAKTYVQGVYNDFREAEVGGIKHLKRLGVNAVEFLPLQKFGYFEPPYDIITSEGIKNTWNHYSRNYWGYMTSFSLPRKLFTPLMEI